MTRINTNVSSLVAQNTLQRSHASLQESLTRLSTGLKINSGKDDPAGLIASEVLRSDITSVQRAITNSQRANQLIATADSALGQVSSLLNDIRGLVSDAANTGALSQAQIDANQLQLDSSLEAIDRIAQTTSFQGRRLLDGSLDFLTSGIGTADIKASGTFGAAAGTNSSGNIGAAVDVAASGNFGSAVDANASVLLSGATGDVTFTALSAGTAANGLKVAYTFSAGAATSATYDGAGGLLQIEVSSVTTAASVVAAVAANASAAAVLSATATTPGAIDSSGAALPATGVLASGSFNNNIVLSAINAGASYNNLQVTFANTAATGAETAAYDTASNTLTVSKHANSTTAQVITAINADGVFSAGTAGGGFGTYSAGTTTSITAGGVDNNNIVLSATSSGTSFNNLAVTFANTAATGSETAAYDTATNTLTVSKHASSTTAQVISAINGNGVFSAGTSGAGLGVYSAGTTTSVTTGGVDNNLIVLSAVFGGTSYNNLRVVLADTSTAGSETAVFNTGTTPTLTVNKGAGSTTAQVIAAINATGVFSASTSGAGLGVYSAGTTNSVTTGGSTGSSALSDLKIDQANFGTASSIAVQVTIDQQATQGNLTYSGGALTSDLTLEVGGKNGFEVFNFGSGTTVDQINTAINLVSDATGVISTVSGTGVSFESNEFGSDAFVSVKALNGSFSTQSNGAASSRNAGTDVSLRINGVQATGRGLQASLNTSTLDLSFTVNDDFQDNSTFNFSITGGGATFQLGPDVVSNQQARLGIQGVSTATLGGVSGTLFELRSGGLKDLSTDVKGAAKVIDEVVSSVTSLRGRLGAFQKTTLETNINALEDTQSILTDAESSIRDADFAAESANLTRAQILVQSGTSVLAIANQNPQSVLALLR